MQDIKKSGIIEELAELKNRLADLTEKQPDEATETTQATDSLPSLDPQRDRNDNSVYR
ncbi:MAG: hypothetical protein VX893_12460 [Candidatus Latescibacterota bacterium]|nr:hypothetical protein [Candidatus Latescibacterota bacterium]